MFVLFHLPFSTSSHRENHNCRRTTAVDRYPWYFSISPAYKGSRRLIEPYSLRRTRAGKRLLLATRHEDGEPRSYRVDRIEGVNVTDRPYTPSYAIERSSAGPLSAPPLKRLTSRLAPRATRQHRKSSYRSPQGPTHIVQCTACGRRYNRDHAEVEVLSPAWPGARP